MQYYLRKDKFSLFTWVVAETLKDPDFDWFLLARYEPKLTEKINLYTQLETLSSVNLDGVLNLTQRMRLGIGYRSWASGFGADLNQTGKNTFVSTTNFGGFLRKEF